MDTHELLQKIGATSANDVTIRTLRNTRGAKPQVAAAMGDLRAEALVRGECVAHCGGRSLGIDRVLAEALIAAGATDKREEAPGAP